MISMSPWWLIKNLSPRWEESKKVVNQWFYSRFYTLSTYQAAFTQGMQFLLSLGTKQARLIQALCCSQVLLPPRNPTLPLPHPSV